jgi:hypothetical protein
VAPSFDAGTYVAPAASKLAQEIARRIRLRSASVAGVCSRSSKTTPAAIAVRVCNKARLAERDFDK